MAQKIEEFDIKKEYGNIALTNKNDFINKYKVVLNLSVGIITFLKAYLVHLTQYF